MLLKFKPFQKKKKKTLYAFYIPRGDILPGNVTIPSQKDILFFKRI